MNVTYISNVYVLMMMKDRIWNAILISFRLEFYRLFNKISDYYFDQGLAHIF